MTQQEEPQARSLLRSMLITGGAQVVNVGTSILRSKILALLLGPQGVGLLGIYNNLQSFVGSAAGLGMATSGVREVARSASDAAALSNVRRVLLASQVLQGTLAAVVVWLARKPLAIWLLEDPSYAGEVGLIGASIVFLLAANAYSALLQGLRRIRDLSVVTISSALISTVIGLVAVWRYQESGLVWLVALQAPIMLAIGWLYAGREPNLAAPPIDLEAAWVLWKPMARLGLAFMLGSLSLTGLLLFIRALITRQLGLDAAGYFAAAWGVTMLYVGFLLNAMGADYYPRLAEIIEDPTAANRLMNDQAQLGIAIAGPVLLLLIGLAPWMIELLYSAKFAEAVPLLQWQSMGNLLKLASWPLSYSVVAAGRARVFLMMELTFSVTFVTVASILMPSLGLFATALGFVAGYAVYLSVCYLVARRAQNFRWASLSMTLLAIHGILNVAVLTLSRHLPPIGAVVSVILFTATSVLGLRVVLSKIGPAGKLAEACTRGYQAIGWPVKWEP